MPFQRLKDDSDDEYVPPTPKRRRRDRRSGSETAGDGVHVPPVAALGRGMPSRGPNLPAESRQPPCTVKGSRTAIDCFSVPEKDQSSRSAGRQHTSEHHTTPRPNTIPDTTIHSKKPQKGFVVATGCTQATEEEGLGDSFKDLDEYLQSLCQFVVEPENL